MKEPIVNVVGGSQEAERKNLTKPFTVGKKEGGNMAMTKPSSPMVKPFVMENATEESQKHAKQEIVPSLMKPFVMENPADESCKQAPQESVPPLVKPFTVERNHQMEKEEKGESNQQTEKNLPKSVTERASTALPLYKPMLMLSEESITEAQRILSANDLPAEMVRILEPHVARGIEKCFQSDPGFLKKIQEEAREKSLLNFSLRLLRIFRKFTDTETGECEERSYVMEILVRKLNGVTKIYTTKVSEEKVKEVQWLKKATGSLATIPSNKDERIEFERVVQQTIEDETVPEEFVYPKAGWRNVPSIGWRYVYSDGAVGFEGLPVHAEGKNYQMHIRESELGKIEIFRDMLGMADICKNSGVSQTLLLYVHACMMATIFDLAGHPLCFVYILQGITNSRKTSLVTAVAKIFNRERLIADAEFATATRCGIEKTASLYKDAPVLIDDFKPGATASQQKEMDRKLDELIRLFGNRVAKKRMTDFASNGGKIFFPVGGGCILTAEILTGVSSTLTRAFVTEIGIEDVDNGVLEYFQTQKWILPTHMYDFLTWVTANFDKVRGFIEINFPKYRNGTTFRYGRHNEMFATFLCTAQILMWYAQDRNFVSAGEKEVFLEETEANVLRILRDLQDSICEKDKGRIILQALTEALELKQMIAAPLNENTCSQKNEVYENTDFYFVRCQTLRKLTDQYCRNYQRPELVSDDELFMLLENLQILDVEERDKKRVRSRKLPIQRGNTLRYLYLRKGKIKELSE